MAHLKLLHRDLGQLKDTAKWDGYLCFLYGLVLRKLDLPHASQVLQEAINLNPLNWAAWIELASLIKNSEMVSLLSLNQLCFKAISTKKVLFLFHLAQSVKASKPLDESLLYGLYLG